MFKVTFIYRKFINSYTDKFIIIERDISIYYIYIYQSHILIHLSQTLYILIFHFLSECWIVESFEATANVVMFYPNTTWLSQSPFWGCDNLAKCHLEMRRHSQVLAE